MRMKIVLGVLAVMLFSMANVYAQGHGMGPGMGPGHRGMHESESWGPAKDYPLTPEQKSKFQELGRRFRDENAKLIGAMVTKRIELQSLWTDPKADPNAILQKEREMRDLQNQMKDKRVQMRLEARKFLTPEQIENWRPGRGMGMGPGHGCGHMGGGGFGRGRGGMGPGHGWY